jgi:hypothetical protein
MRTIRTKSATKFDPSRPIHVRKINRSRIVRRQFHQAAIDRLRAALAVARRRRGPAEEGGEESIEEGLV